MKNIVCVEKCNSKTSEILKLISWLIPRQPQKQKLFQLPFHHTLPVLDIVHKLEDSNISSHPVSINIVAAIQTCELIHKTYSTTANRLTPSLPPRIYLVTAVTVLRQNNIKTRDSYFVSSNDLLITQCRQSTPVFLNIFQHMISQQFYT